MACPGANTSVPQAQWEHGGGFDEDFGTAWGCEDLELGLRWRESGTRMLLADAAPGVRLTHERADRWEQHTVDLARCTDEHPLAAARALTVPLGLSGNAGRYVETVRTLEGSDRT
ncbi:glycosyltransferase family 2 protein [Streptomyces sp. NPDC002755]|uniref:glycosyltransferase family 2 protein n=1 Tax=Streptomyces sp. NPDC002884 TaxID=3154544 RepID=UPI00333188DA